MLSMLFSSAMALTCAPDDISCNTANAIRDLVNQQRPNSIGDARSGKRGTNFVHARVQEIEAIGEAAGCVPVGISAVVVNRGDFTGEWVDIDFVTGLPSASGTYEGGFNSSNEINGTWDFGTVGDWGRFHFPSGKLAALRGSPDDFLVGGLARINGQNAVAWGIHGTCDGLDVAFELSAYMPQLEQYVTAAFPECLPFDVTVENAAPAELGTCDCIDAVCAADDFCCTEEWDDICVGEVDEFCGAGGSGGEPVDPLDPASCAPFDPLTEGNAATGAECGCTAAVCDSDDFCCEEEWDGICVEGAQAICIDGEPGPA